MSAVNWGILEAMTPGKKRNAAMVGAIAAFLSERRWDAPALSTLELAYMLWPENAKAVSKLLIDLAPQMRVYARPYSVAPLGMAWRWYGTNEG